MYLPFKLSTLATYSPTHQLTNSRADQLSAHHLASSHVAKVKWLTSGRAFGSCGHRTAHDCEISVGSRHSPAAKTATFLKIHKKAIVRGRHRAEPALVFVWLRLCCWPGTFIFQVCFNFALATPRKPTFVATACRW